MIEQSEIEENNKLIAEFMGYKLLRKKFQYEVINSSNESYWAWDESEVVCNQVDFVLEDDTQHPFFDLNDLPFKSSWEWLMDVVEKIEMTKDPIRKSKNMRVDIKTHCTTIFVADGYENDYFYNGFGGSKKEATYKAVVEFIKWFNEQKK